MCLQCVTHSTHYKAEFLPGWYLGQATNDNAPEEWPKGAFGLIRCNDPDFIITCPIVAPPENPGDGDQAIAYAKACRELYYDLGGGVFEGWLLVEAAKEVGFEPSKNPTDFSMWLMGRLYTWVTEIEYEKHSEDDEVPEMVKPK